MFPAPVDLGIAQPDRAVSSVTHGTEAYLDGQRRRGRRAGTRAAASAADRAVQGITIYPPTGGVQTQGDPFEPVKIGILIDMDLNQLLADWIDPTILAIEDALNEGVWARGPDPARHRRRPRPAPRELPQGHRRLPLAGRPGLRRRARADDLRQLARAAGHRQRARRRRASAGPAPTSSPPTTASRSPTATSPPRASMCAQWLAGQGHHARSARSGSRARRAATTPTTSATPPLQLGLDRRPRGEARAQPQGPRGRPAP